MEGGAAAGCEKLKPSEPDLAPASREKPEVVVLLMVLVKVLEVVRDAPLPKGEFDSEVVCGLAGSGLALKMGLKTASLAGLKLKSDPNPLLWVTA